MEQPQISVQQKEQNLTVSRKNSYLKFLKDYSLYSMLMVLQEYEEQELYEECAIIRDALNDHKKEVQGKFSKEVLFPMHISTYMDRPFQSMMEKANIVVEEKSAREKATLIKLKLPLNGNKL